MTDVTQEHAPPDPATQDHFARFGLARAFAIDEPALEAAHQRMSMELHPDFFAAAPDAEKQAAERRAAAFNEAYRILRSPTRRAQYLLRLLADGRALDTDRLPEGFLQEMFLLQESVDELGEDGDSAEREALRQDAERRLNAVWDDLGTRFDAAVADPTTERLQEIQSQLNCSKYLQRLLDRLSD
jgi:molecular chaperone HscB